MSSNYSPSHYLHGAQRAWIQQLARQWHWRLELPTWGVIALVYGSWFGVVHYWLLLGPWLGTPLLIIATSGYMSLQHELIHGHPTRWPRLNHLLGLLPLAVWYPYGLYRDAHLKHHRDQYLTLPEEDPESYYFSQAQWQRWPILLPLLTKVRNTLIGRVTLGPALDIAATLIEALKTILAGDLRTLTMWLVQGALLVPMLLWLQAHGVSAAFYLLAVSYPALGLTKVRSFFEHRAAEAPPARSVINEASWPWRLLFLNLNYHLVHHDLPGLPWYGLRQVYLAEQRAYRQRSQGFVVAGYGAWLADYAVTPIAVEVHPFAAADLTSDTQNDWPTLALTRWVGAAQDFPTDPAP